MSDEQTSLFPVAELSQVQRMQRVTDLIAESHTLVDQALAEHLDNHQLAAVVGLFSGGNDSTTLIHLMQSRLTHAAHCNTGIGIEQTRQFVRDTCKAWNLPLLERHPPAGSTYRDLLLDRQPCPKNMICGGFPGPAMHFKMYSRLKERALEQVRRELVTNPRKQRVLFLAGRRRSESARRAMVPEMERRGSTIWCSPLVNWTALDLNTYRQMFTVPHNEVTDILHMSGECLCGAFATPGEMDEIALWYPQAYKQIKGLEMELLFFRPDLPEHRRKWGWGANHKETRAVKSAGIMCSGCEWRQETLL